VYALSPMDKRHNTKLYWKILAFRLAIFSLVVGAWFLLENFAGYWKNTEMVRQAARQFRSEASKLQIGTLHLVPNLEHSYKLTERPEGDELIPLGKSRHFRTDQFGFVKGELHEREGGILKILFLGGSTTETNEVDEQFRFPFLVGQKLSERLTSEIVGINGGVRGHTTQDSLNLLINHPGYEQAEIYAILHNINDRLFLSHQGHYKAWLSEDAPTTWEAVDSGIKNLAESFFDYLSYKNNIIFLARSYIESVNPWTGEVTEGVITERSIDFQDPEFEKSIKQFKKNLNLLVGIIRSLGKTPVLMTQPLGRYSESQEMFNNAIRSIADEQKVAFIDLDLILPPNEEREWLFSPI